jgi:hypothetical protein
VRAELEPRERELRLWIELGDAEEHGEGGNEQSRE